MPVVDSYQGIPFRMAGCFDCGKAASARVEFKVSPSISTLTVHYPPGWRLSVSKAGEIEHVETICSECVARRAAGGGSDNG
jgi:hypothetical protein